MPSTESYRGLMARLRELDGSVLGAREAQVLREAADARLFGDDDQVEALERALELLGTLVQAARLSSRTSLALTDLLCGIESAGVQGPSPTETDPRS